MISLRLFVLLKVFGDIVYLLIMVTCSKSMAGMQRSYLFYFLLVVGDRYCVTLP